MSSAIVLPMSPPVSQDQVVSAISNSVSKTFSSSGLSLFFKICIFVFILFVIAVCFVNIIEQVKVRNDYNANDSLFKDSPTQPVQSISTTWITFGIVANSMILVVAFVLGAILLYYMIKGKDLFERQSRVLIRQVIGGARRETEAAVDTVMKNAIIDPTDIEGSKAAISVEIKSMAQNLMDKYTNQINYQFDK